MDMESITRWEEYSRAKDEMMVHTDIAEARWNEVESEDKLPAFASLRHHVTDAAMEFRKVFLFVIDRDNDRVGYLHSLGFF
jgi:polyphosphate kinase 2 (PPK2 family)